MSENSGPAWWEAEPEVVLIRIAKQGQPVRIIRAKPEDLQRVLDKAAREFADSSRPSTPPFPESFGSDLSSRPPKSRPMAASTGRRRRGS